MIRKLTFAAGMLTAAITVLSAAPASAQSADQSFQLLGGVGYTWLTGNELVYDAAGNRISHLVWDSQAPVLTLGARAEVMNGWKIIGNAKVGFSGNSFMRDSDWLAPFSPSFDANDWSDRSWHPDTDLDHYFDLDIAIAKDVIHTDTASLNLQGGFKYTDVKWTAYGGDFNYSVGGFRDTSGSFPDGERGITYQQRYPAVFIGTEGAIQSGAWTFTGLLRGGVTFNASDTDHHWMRDLRFEEDFSSTPFVSIGAKVDYALSTRMSIYLAGNFDKYFRKKGDTSMYNIPSGALIATFPDGAGMDFQSTSLTIGAKVAF